jgi:hypothetical protein
VGRLPHPINRRTSSDNRRSESTDWGAWFACASIAVPACERIWDRVNCTISSAMSVSRIRLSDADRFSTATLRELMVCSKRFCEAPSSARVVDTFLICVSTVVMAVPLPIVAARPVIVLATVARLAVMLTVSVSAAVAPTWKVSDAVVFSRLVPLKLVRLPMSASA